MSRRKRIAMIFLGLIVFFASACSSKQVLLETGETLMQETEQEMILETESDLREMDSKALIYVYVCGQVISPGVYVLSEGDRIYQAIDMAGGILPEGDAAKLNLAQLLEDGQKVYVPSVEEAGAWTESEGTDETSKDQRIDINRASKDVLMTLPGIGESKADAILAYRETNGPFDSVEALMDVPGIKEGVYSKIKDRISIN